MSGEEGASDLPERFKDIPVEFRVLQQRLDKQRVFTNVSNEVRLESKLRCHYHKEDKRSEVLREMKPKYMSRVDNNLDMFREIERIVNSDGGGGVPYETSKQSSEKVKPTSMIQSRSTGYINRRKQESEKLPSIKARYGRGVMSNWQKGPIDLPKDRYFDLNDESIYAGNGDARARRLRQQTKMLMNSFQTTSKRANINSICRKRRIDESKQRGEDHVVGSFDDLIAAEQDMERTTKVSIVDDELLAELAASVKFRKRNMKRNLNGRVLEMWDCLACPPSSKLSFKLQSSVHVPTTSASAHNNADGSIPSQNTAIGNSSAPVTVISQLEHLADGVFALNTFVLLKQLWIERKYPDIYTSSRLTQQLIDICRGGGVDKCAKQTGEKMLDWLSRLIEELWRLLTPQLTFWHEFSLQSLDKHFTGFVENLHQELSEFISLVEKEKAIDDKPSPSKKGDQTADCNAESSTDNSCVVDTVTVANLTDMPSESVVHTASFTTGSPDEEASSPSKTNVMKDESVKYNTKTLPHKTQKIYDSLPPILDSVNINKVSRNLLKAPNKILSKRLERIQQRRLQDGDDNGNDDFY